MLCSFQILASGKASDSAEIEVENLETEDRQQDITINTENNMSSIPLQLNRSSTLSPLNELNLSAIEVLNDIRPLKKKIIR